MKERRWHAVIETVTGVSVVITLVVLVVEVRANTQALNRQMEVDRAQVITGAFLEPAELLTAYEQVKARDGFDPEVRAFMETYGDHGMGARQAIVWTRFLLTTWMQIYADYQAAGPTDELGTSILGLLNFPDNQLIWETLGPRYRLQDPGFHAWVEEIRASPNPIAELEGGGS